MTRKEKLLIETVVDEDRLNGLPDMGFTALEKEMTFSGGNTIDISLPESSMLGLYRDRKGCHGKRFPVCDEMALS